MEVDQGQVGDLEEIVIGGIKTFIIEKVIGPASPG
jgi:hypothetical protein